MDTHVVAATPYSVARFSISAFPFRCGLCVRTSFHWFAAVEARATRFTSPLDVMEVDGIAFESGP